MAWVHIEDNAKAWELYQAGLLWFGDKNTGMRPYPVPQLGWTRKEWLSTRFDGTDGRPNYILVED